MKMKFVDILVTVLFLIALVVIYFFWNCRLDAYVLAMCLVVIASSVGITVAQNKKIRELEK